ncbi:hypothetical protein [Psychroserpens algicola]|uniref:MukB N-terminal domain-containing protein n=1 Tax=Psychroserpens algicola TaxID=1719034 RepID=A0ABT0H5X6_9FLAO|nr:hypothetical protein [Psychroserpens algicola]MCK8479768.1 hypothetical protein [Psychroserpens algicola]
MNKLPLIHSISTVNVVKHYNQDYLVHDTRTDFTGPNGIGKSLLADLLQILFIAERKKIHFGTDSVKKEHRQIHTIPFNGPNAYFFLNIEVEHKMYLTFGVNIPNTSSGQIKLFRVLNAPFDASIDSRKTVKERQNISEYLIPENRLIYHNNFIINKTIPSIDVLTRHLRDNYELHLDIYSKKAERKELYQFFYDKNILPLNLSQEAHLTAFAKVLQAFSKANTLDTDKDVSLKNFLFENKKAEIEDNYKQNKKNLDDYVARYKNLSLLIETLKGKREFLEDLEMLSKAYTSSEKEYFQYKYHQQKHQFETQCKEWEDIVKREQKLKTDISKQKKALPDLETKANEAINKFKIYSTALSNLNTYKNNHEAFQAKTKTYTALRALKIPKGLDQKSKQFDFTNSSPDAVIEKVNHLLPLIKTYGSVDKIELQYQSQVASLNALKKKLQDDKVNTEKLIDILNLDNDKSFASKILKENKSISLGQETILREFLLDMHWEFPENVLDAVMYAENINILDNNNIKKDEGNGGYWFTMGGIHRFIKALSSERLFENSEALSKAFTLKKETLNTQVNDINETLKQIISLEQGKTEVLEQLDFDFKWDINIPDQRQVNEYRKTLEMIQSLDALKENIKSELTADKNALEVLSKTIPFNFSTKNFADELEKCNTEQDTLNQAQLKANSKHQEAKTLIKTLSEQLESINFNPEEVEAEKQKLQSNLTKEKKRITDKYPELKDVLDKWKTNEGKDYQEVYVLAKTAYEQRYDTTLTSYKELNDDIEIKDKKQHQYEFKLLEKKLLGNDIGTTKNIESALSSLYINRNKLAKTIIDSMLSIFSKTQDEYDNYKKVVTNLNTFFKGELISKKYYFQIVFDPSKKFSVNWINDLSSKAQAAGLFNSDNVEKFVEESFQEISGYSDTINFSDLLDPKTYFTLKTEFKDDDGKEYPGSTGESYTARVLLGIGRLSITSKNIREGLKFLILEEVSNLDDDNFNTFPEIAKKYGYQIITMTPEPFGSNNDDGWYLHQLIEGKTDKNRNYPIPNSSFKTNYKNEQLQGYLKRMNQNELG